MISGIIMASGFSKRMGENKLLMNFKGKKLIEYVIKANLQSKIDEILLIYRDENIRNIGLSYGIKTIYNGMANLGQSQSIIKGVKNASGESYMFFPGDQPFITKDLIDLLINEHLRDRGKITIPYFKGKRYTPTIFSKAFREELLKIQGDRGGREIIERNPEKIQRIHIDNEDILADLDTLDDFDYWSST